jgi:hypothetical protein
MTEANSAGASSGDKWPTPSRTLSCAFGMRRTTFSRITSMGSTLSCEPEITSVGELILPSSAE